jgi:outer membrane autotransporter protein
LRGAIDEQHRQQANLLEYGVAFPGRRKPESVVVACGETSTDFVLYAAWAHEWASQRTLSSRLAGDAVGAPFQVRGAAASRNSAQVGLGLAHRLRDDLSLFVDVDGEFNGEQQTVGFSAGLNLRW